MTETPQPENQKPLTREDVLRCIEKNGCTAQGLDLSGAVFQQNPPPSLRNMDLRGIILARAQMPSAVLFETDLSGACLCGANLREANLENTILQNASLRGTILERANLRGASLAAATLSGAFFSQADISTSRIESASWLEGKIVGEEKALNFGLAGEVYRALKARYTVLGFHEVAGDFYYAEREAYRKAWWHGPSPPPNDRPNAKAALSRAFSESTGAWPEAWCPMPSPPPQNEHDHKKDWGALKDWSIWTLFKWLCGYGERPLWVVGWWVATIVGSWLAYWWLGGLPWDNALYFSAVSFSAVGYGFTLRDTSLALWAHGVGAAEAFIGVFLIALFLTTFVRKMTR